MTLFSYVFFRFLIKSGTTAFSFPMLNKHTHISPFIIVLDSLLYLPIVTLESYQNFLKNMENAKNICIYIYIDSFQRKPYLPVVNQGLMSRNFQRAIGVPNWSKDDTMLLILDNINTLCSLIFFAEAGFFFF